MLTKYKDVRPKKSVRSPLKVFSCLQRIREIFSRTGHSNLSFFKRVFFGQNHYIENKKSSRGSGGKLPRKFFENSHAVVVISALFEQFLGIFCLNFLPLSLRVSLNMMHFVRTFLIMRA